MKRRHFLKSVLCIILCLSMLTSCSSLGSRVSGENTEPKYPKSNADNGKPLTIYCTESEGGEFSTLIKAYNRQAEKNEQLEIVSYGFNAENPSSSETAQTQLLTDLTAGKGPDLLAIGLMNFSANQQTAILNGMFQDLNYYFNQSSMDWSKYNSGIMNSGLYHAKRYLVPISYQVGIYATTKNKLEQYGIPETIDFSLNDYRRLLSYQEKLNFNKTGIFNIAPDISLHISSFIDYENKTHTFNSPQFKLIIQQYQSLYQSQNMEDFLFENLLAYSSPQLMLKYISQKSVHMEADDSIILIEDKENMTPGTTAVPWNNIAINANSPNGERAFKFIQWVLSESIQKSDYISGIPVYKDAVESQIKNGLSIYIQKNSTSSLLTEYTRIINNITSVQSYSNMRFVNDIFWPLWEDFLDDKITVEELSKQLSDKTDIYLQEL